MTQHQAIHQIVELAQHRFFGSIRLVHASRTFHIVIIKKLRRIIFQFTLRHNFIDGFQRLPLLLQVIIIDGRGDGKL